MAPQTAAHRPALQGTDQGFCHKGVISLTDSCLASGTPGDEEDSHNHAETARNNVGDIAQSAPAPAVLASASAGPGLGYCALGVDAYARDVGVKVKALEDIGKVR